MGLSIKNAETERIVRELARRKGVGVTKAIRLAASNELARELRSPATDWAKRWSDIEQIQARSRALPILDNRSDDEILGYGDDGLPE
jgi:antitoxin VapB